MKRVGIYAGTFDPVHAGHIAFALQAMKEANLDVVYFLPERQPRHKQGVEHFGHRVAMLHRASRPHQRFGVLEMPDVNFSVQRTIPRLKKKFPKAQLVFLFGSDVVRTIPSWDLSQQMLAESEIVVGLREGSDVETLQTDIDSWPTQPKACRLVASYAPGVSSGTIREALRKREYARGLLASVHHYSERHWLYVSLA